MSETRKPVWVWLPGNAEPVQCGQFSLHDKVGSFEYLSDYRDRPDDHPRNHGIVHVEGRWSLSPAFDIAPYITYSGTQAMAMTRSGSSMASRANLLSAQVLAWTAHRPRRSSTTLSISCLCCGNKKHRRWALRSMKCRRHRPACGFDRLGAAAADAAFRAAAT